MSNRNFGLGPAAGEYSAEDDNQLQPQTRFGISSNRRALK